MSGPSTYCTVNILRFLLALLISSRLCVVCNAYYSLKSQWEALRREQKEETAGDSDNAGDNNNGDAAAAGAPAGDHTEGGAAVGTSGVVGSSSSAVAPMFDTGTATAEDDSSDGEDTGIFLFIASCGE